MKKGVQRLLLTVKEATQMVVTMNHLDERYSRSSGGFESFCTTDILCAFELPKPLRCSFVLSHLRAGLQKTG
jgi:hypothetical protein